MRSSCAAIVGLLALTVPSWASDPIGQWLVAKRYAKVDIVNCSGRLWGVVSWEARVGAVDRNNPDPAKRTRPTVGLPILLAMKQTEPNRWEGEIYNAEDGKTYASNISLIDRDTLKVQGCVLGFLCGGENWTRVKDDVGPAGRKPESRRGAAPGSGRGAMAKGSAQGTTMAAQTPEEICSRIDGVAGAAH